jgi:hypothetical protein
VPRIPASVLTLRELNRATLERQLLLTRRRLPPARAVGRLAGMQAQWPAAPYVGLWSRLAGFRRESLERAVLDRSVVKATLMRSTLHLVARADYPLFAVALTGMRTWADEVIGDAEPLVPHVRALAANGPLTMQDALAYLEREHGHVDVHARRVWHAVRTRAHVHHAPETALWSSQPRAVYVALEEPDGIDVAAARVELLRRYLAAFGPATRADLADWSGLRVGDFDWDTLPLRRLRSEDGRELLDLPRAPLPAGDTPAPVRFLPKWDSVLLAFKDRARVLPDEYRKAVIRKNGDVAQTFLVDGVVRGTWRVEKERVVVEPFEPLPRAARAAVEDEAHGLAAFINSDSAGLGPGAEGRRSRLPRRPDPRGR